MSAPYLRSIATRRTIYQLGRQNFPLSHAEVTAIVTDIVKHTPSSFNSQTTRAVIIFDKNHEKLWGEFAHDALKAISSSEEAFAATKAKLDMFKGAYGTVLFFEDDNGIKKMQEQFPLYASKFPEFASHSSGAAQINVWTALALENVGANLQHYSPLIDADVHKAFNVPENFRLTAQLVFGSKVGEAGEKTFLADTVRTIE